MSNTISVGQFWADESGDVYEVVEAAKESILVHHTWKSEAWQYDSVKSFKSEMKTLLTGKRHKRTEILADVIKQLDAKKFIAIKGTYCSIKYDEFTTIDAFMTSDLKKEIKEKLNITKDNDNLQSVICNDRISCRVCALGSLFIASVDVNNKVKASDYIDDEDGFDDSQMVDHLHKWFSEKELRLIEFAFEGCNVKYLKELEPYATDIIRFRRDVDANLQNIFKDDNVLRHIIANTIKHGSFKPELGLA